MRTRRCDGDGGGCHGDDKDDHAEDKAAHKQRAEALALWRSVFRALSVRARLEQQYGAGALNAEATADEVI